MPEPLDLPSGAPLPPAAPLDRRGFLAAAGGLLLTAACARPAGDAQAADSAAAATAADTAGARAAAQPAAGLRRDAIGLMLYTVRGELERDFAGTLERIAAIGYREVEFAGYFGHAPADVRALLERHGLRAPGAHVPYDRTGDGWPAALAEAKAVGHQYVVIPWLAEEARRTLDDWKRVAERLNQAGAAARDAGLQLGYHNHEFEFARVDGQLPYDVLLAETDPALVVFELDLYWTVHAGQDPLAYFTRHPDRYRLVHVKDSAGPPDHRMTDVGAGTIDFARILPAAARAGVVHYFVEHDNPSDPMASLRTSFAAMTRLAA
jgi:sugar phosphate isomerase/epimerase